MKKLFVILVTLIAAIALVACDNVIPVERHIVTFNSNGGSAVDAVEVEHGKTITKPTDPARTGYTFGGWFKESTLTTEWIFATDVVEADITLYAKWTPNAPVLTSITFEGVGDVELEFDTPFNVFDGVRAKGNDNQYYDDLITIQSVSITNGNLDAETGELNPQAVGTHAVRYSVTVPTSQGNVTAQVWRNIVIKNPAPVEGQMLLNGDFSQGTAGWTNPNVNYIADGAEMTLSVEDGALKVEVVAGANVYTPRFGQDQIPFDNGKTYEISFDAKSSVEKTINLQVGELLPAAPYFVDFKPGISVHKTITTDWARYSYKFTMNQPETNHRGSILFELGKLNDQAINATMWFDNITIEETTPDEDVDGPVFTGIIPEQNILVGSVFNPLAGVTAFDVTDGNVTDEITLTIFEYENGEQGDEVDAVDTSKVGSFLLVYYVEDSLGNDTTVEAIVHVVDLLFKNSNLITNGSFDDELSDPAEWTVWSQDWDAAPVVVADHDDEAGTFSLDITGGGDAAWAVQFTQPEEIGLELVYGTTYKLSFKVKSSVARKISVTLGYAYGDNQYEEYFRQNGVEVGTEYQVFEYVFTNQKDTHVVKLVFELGSQDGFADGVLTFDEVGLYELDVDPIIVNSNLDKLGWRGFYNDWDGTSATWGIVDGVFTMTINNLANTGAGNWVLQLIQDAQTVFGGVSEDGLLVLEPNTTYTLSYEAWASHDATIVPIVAVPGLWVNFVDATGAPQTITTEKTVYTTTFTTPAEITGTEVFKFEFGHAWGGDFAEVKWIKFDNISAKKQGDENAPELIINGTFEGMVGGHEFLTEPGGNTVAVTEDGYEFTVTTLGEAWQPHYYYIIPTLAAGDYIVVFELTSSVARDLRFNVILPDAGYASILPGNAHDFEVDADETVVVAIQFTVAAPLTNVKIELDFGTLGGELTSVAGVFTLHNIQVYPIIA